MFFVFLVIIHTILHVVSSLVPYNVSHYKTCHTPHEYDFILDIEDTEDTQYLSGLFLLGNIVNNENYFFIHIDKQMKDNNYRRIVTIKQTGICKALITYGGSIYLDALTHLEPPMPHPQTCPLEKGNYTLTRYEVNYELVPLVKLVPKGVYHVLMQAYYSDGRNSTCLDVHFEKTY